MVVFQSTLPARGATTSISSTSSTSKISIHAPRTGSDRGLRPRDVRLAHFNPRSPHGERHIAEIIITVWVLFQSTLPARGATPPKHGSTRIPGISIHAPRTGSDRDWKRGAENPERISIHAPRTGSDRDWKRGAENPERISIHAPRTGSDDISAIAKDKYNQFQSTLPARGATDAGTKRGTSGQFQSTLPARGATMADVRDGPLYRFQSTLPARGATCAY